MEKEFAPKKVELSQVKEDLLNGLTKWKKDDIGFGSLEKKYSLTFEQMIKLINHPKVEKIETRIPTFIIIDDLEDLPEETPNVATITVAEQVQPVVESPKTIIEVAPVKIKAEVKEEKIYEAFI